MTLLTHTSRRSPPLALLLIASCIAASAVSAQSSTSVLVLGNEFRGVTRPGDLFRLQITAARGGNGVGVNAFVEVTLPAELQFIALSFESTAADCTTPAVGASGSIYCLLPTTGTFASVRLNLDVRVDGAASIGSILTTAAVAGSDVPNPIIGSSSLTLRTLVQSGTEVADLQVRIESDPNPVAPGALLTQRIILENLGPDMAAWSRITFSQPYANVQFHPGAPTPVPGTFAAHVDLPDGWLCDAIAPLPTIPTGPAGYSCSMISLPPGVTTFTWTGTARGDVIGPIRLAATAIATSIDPVPSNNATGDVLVPIGFPQATPIPLSTRWTLALLALLVAVSTSVALLRRR